jgi:deoxyribodipyrimidine photo-lyase
MIDALHSLQRDLSTAGSRLVIRHGEPHIELLTLARQTNAQGVYFNRDYSSFARRRDALVQRTFAEQGLLAKDFKELESSPDTQSH